MTTEEQQILTPTTTEERVLMLQQIAEEIHPGNWDLGLAEPALAQKVRQYVSTEGFIQRLIIRFPETTILNSDGFSRTIKDFYIAILFNSDFSEVLTNRMFSMRSTVTTEEYACGVFHPHSTTQGENKSDIRDYFTWREMCLGGGTELDHLMITLRNDGMTRKDIFELLVLLHTYAGWESIEGGPYKRMNTWSYPTRSNAGHRTQLKLEWVMPHIYNVFKNDDTIPIPELINTNGIVSGVTNISTSFAPAVKNVLLKLLHDPSLYFPPQSDDRDRFDITSLVIRNLGTHSENGIFSQISYAGNGNELKKDRSFYEGIIAQVSDFNLFNSEDVLCWGSNGVDFEITLEEIGLGGQTEITDNQLLHCEVNLNYVRLLVQEYLDAYNTFIMQNKI